MTRTRQHWLSHNNDSDPIAEIIIDDDTGTVEVNYIVDDGYTHLGYAPTPRNQREWFIHHVCNGLLMRYPVWKVILWSWKHRKGNEVKS